MSGPSRYARAEPATHAEWSANMQALIGYDDESVIVHLHGDAVRKRPTKVTE